MKKLPALIALGLFALPAWAGDFDMASYLQGLNRYYYCFSTAGLKSFQAQASVDLSGELPKGLASSWQGFNWQNAHPQFDFSYVGSGVMPILSYSSSGGDPSVTPERMRRLANLLNGILQLWGELVATPFFEPPSKDRVYTIAHHPGAAFTIVLQKGRTTTSVDYDEKSLAKKAVFETPRGRTELELQFFNSPRGALPERVGMQVQNRTTNAPIAVDLVVQYQDVQGFELPSSLIFYQRAPGQFFQATFHLSNYSLQSAAEIAQSSDNGDTQVVPGASEGPGAKHFLWKVQSPTATVYLLGSIHVRPNVPLQVPEVVENAFEASSYVGFELDLSKLDEMDKEYDDYVQDHFTYPAGDDLTKHLTLEQWRSLELTAKVLKVPVGRILKLKPYIVDDYLGRRGRLKEMDKVIKKNGIDMIFLRKAQKAHKPVFGMEFWYEPFKVLDSLPEPEQVYYLFGSRAASSNRIRFLDEIFADWKTGNTVDLESLTNSGLSLDDKAIMDKIVRQRNEYWVPQLDRLLASRGSFFVVVGSAHLVGPHGLPSLLSEKGYTVEQQ